MKKITLLLMAIMAVCVTVNATIEEITMLPGNAEIVKCPYCGTEKELMTLLSGNTFGAVYWSDNKRIAPMLPSVSPVQKCPNCRKYYFEFKHRHGESKNTSFERGELTFHEWKEAYDQFQAEGVGGKDMTNVQFWVVQSYNDYFYRGKTSAKPSEEEFQIFSKMAVGFIDSFDWEPVKHPLLKAELYREANLMKECKEVLDSIPYEELEDFEKSIYNDIKHRMEKNDKVVFKLSV